MSRRLVERSRSQKRRSKSGHTTPPTHGFAPPAATSTTKIRTSKPPRDDEAEAGDDETRASMHRAHVVPGLLAHAHDALLNHARRLLRMNSEQSDLAHARTHSDRPPPGRRRRRPGRLPRAAPRLCTLTRSASSLVPPSSHLAGCDPADAPTRPQHLLTPGHAQNRAEGIPHAPLTPSRSVYGARDTQHEYAATREKAEHWPRGQTDGSAARD